MTDADFDASFETQSMILAAELHAVQQRGGCRNIDSYSYSCLGILWDGCCGLGADPFG